MRANHSRGFTLLELLIAVTIGSLLLSLAYPGMVSFINNQALVSSTNQLVGALNFARETAGLNKTAISICPSSDGSNCSTHARWNEGWIIFEDPNRDLVHQQEEKIHRRDTPNNNDINISTSHGRPGVRFLSDGSAAGSNATFNICHPNEKAKKRLIIVSNMGRVKSKALNQNNC